MILYIFLFLFLFFFTCFLLRYDKKGTYDKYNYYQLFPAQKRRGRPVVRESKLEKETRAALEEMFEMPFRKKRPDFLENPITGCNLEIDCFNKELNLGVEINGKQHYEFVPFFHKTHDRFRLQQYKDNLKKRMCKENGVDLIEIPYDVKNVKKFLFEEISKISRLKQKILKK